jgi:hypothetical protein
MKWPRGFRDIEYVALAILTLCILHAKLSERSLLTPVSSDQDHLGSFFQQQVHAPWERIVVSRDGKRSESSLQNVTETQPENPKGQGPAGIENITANRIPAGAVSTVAVSQPKDFDWGSLSPEQIDRQSLDDWISLFERYLDPEDRDEMLTMAMLALRSRGAGAANQLASISQEIPLSEQSSRFALDKAAEALASDLKGSENSKDKAGFQQAQKILIDEATAPPMAPLKMVGTEKLNSIDRSILAHYAGVFLVNGEYQTSTDASRYHAVSALERLGYPEASQLKDAITNRDAVITNHPPFLELLKAENSKGNP